MATLANLTVNLIANISDFQSKMQAASQKMSDVGRSLQMTGAKLTIGVTAPLTALAAVSVNAASDLSESMNKVDVVFAESADTIQKWATTSATSMGITQQQALEAAGTFGNLFDAMGVGQDETVAMSQGLVQLAADLASFNNIDPTEALDKLRAGIVGETEPLRTLGVNLSAAAVQMRALEMTGKDTAKALTEQEKVAARYAIIMEQTSNAQGDFARTSDGLANSQRILKAQVGDLAAQFGQIMLPIVQDLVNFIRPLVERFKGLDPEIQKVIVAVGAFAAAIGPVLTILGTLGTALGALLSPIGLVVAAVAGLALAWKENFLGIRDTFQPLVDAVGVLFTQIKALFGEFSAFLKGDITWQEFSTKAKQWLGYAFGQIRQSLIEIFPPLEKLFEWLDAKIPAAFESVKAAIQPVIDWVVRFFTTIAWGVEDGWSLQEFIEVISMKFPELTGVIEFATSAAQALSNVWSSVLQPALATVWSFIQASVIPALGELFSWLADNLPVAIDALAQFWTNTLLPAIRVVWTFIQNNVLPLLETLLVWLATNLPIALKGLAEFWQNVLKPAIEIVWAFLKNDVIPLLKALADVVIAALKLALTALAGLWENVLLPAIKTVVDFIKNQVLPKFDQVKKVVEGPLASALNFIKGVFEAVGGAIGGISGAIQTVIGWLDSLKNKLSSIVLPPWLNPGSPTPFEIGLRGITDALKGVNNEMRDFASQMPSANIMAPMMNANTQNGYAMAGAPVFNITINASGEPNQLRDATRRGVIDAARALGWM